MSCSVFKWGAGWRRGFCYSGASWAQGSKDTACCICFLSVLLIVVFFSLCHSVKLFSSQPMRFCLFSFWFFSPSHQEGGSERVTAWFFVANWGKATAVLLCFMRAAEAWKARLHSHLTGSKSHAGWGHMQLRSWRLWLLSIFSSDQRRVDMVQTALK